MERRRRLGRGLDDISHYFISQDQENEESDAPLFIRKGTKCQVVSIVDLFNPHRGACLTSALAIELCKNDISTLIIDTDPRFPGIAHTLGLSVPGFLIKHYIKNQYTPSDLIYNSRSGLKFLAPRLSEKEMLQMKRSEMALIFETLTSVEQEVDVIIQRQYESRFRLLIEDGVFLVPALHAGMIRAYREIKLFISGMDRKRVGIVMTDAPDEVNARKAYDKISGVISSSCGIKPAFCGYITDMETFSVSGVARYIKEVVINDRDPGTGRALFFERLQFLIGSDNVCSEEISSLLL